MLFVFCPTLSPNMVHITAQNSSYCYPFNAKTFRHAYDMYSLSLSVFVTIRFLSRKKSITFAADKTAKCVQMQAKNNFSSSVSFNIFYLVEPNKSVTHTHTHTTFYPSKSLYKGDCSAPSAGCRPTVSSICKELSKLFADAFSRVCVTEPVKQEINSSKYNHLNRIKNEEKIV